MENFAETWQVILNRDFNVMELNKLFSQIYSLTNSAKLRTLQYRTLLRRLSINPYLKRCKIKNTEMCSFRHESIGTIEYIFWECDKVQPFWSQVQLVICRLTYVRKEDLDMCKENVLFNKMHFKVNNIANLICLIAKYYLF